MADIEVKITIPEDEYKEWHEYSLDGVAMVKQQLMSDFKKSCLRLGINCAEIEINHNE